MVFAGGEDGRLRAWDASTSAPRYDVAAAQEEIVVLRVGPSGEVVTGGYDGALLVWDPATGTPVLQLGGHTNEIRSIAFSADGTQMVTASFDRSAKIWSLRDPLTTTLNLGGPANFCDFTADGMALLTQIQGNTQVVRWDLATRTPVVLGDAGGAVPVTSGDGRLALVDGPGAVTIVDLTSGAHRLLSVGAHSEYLAMSSDGRLLATAAGSVATVWDVASGERRWVLSGHDDEIFYVSFSHDARRLATASKDQSARIWDLATGRPTILKGHTDAILNVAFDADDTHVGTASSDRTARIWTVDGRFLQQLPGHRAAALRVDFAGELVITEDWAGRLYVWDRDTGHLLDVRPVQRNGPLVISRQAYATTLNNYVLVNRLPNLTMSNHEIETLVQCRVPFSVDFGTLLPAPQKCNENY
jgi:WD40 repeat protein